jgi:hypothetical protein
MGNQESSKNSDLLVDNFQETLKSVDTALLLTFISVVFLLIHGLQGDYILEFEEQNPQAVREIVDENNRAVREQNAVNGQETEVPFLGLKAQLLTASLIALTLYFILPFWAASRVHLAYVITNQLSESNEKVLDAILFYPSIATGGKGIKIAYCVALGGIGYGSFLLIYAPLRPQELNFLLASGLVMLVPPSWLCWRLLKCPSYVDAKNKVTKVP